MYKMCMVLPTLKIYDFNCQSASLQILGSIRFGFPTLCRILCFCLSHFCVLFFFFLFFGARFPILLVAVLCVLFLLCQRLPYILTPTSDLPRPVHVLTPDLSSDDLIGLSSRCSLELQFLVLRPTNQSSLFLLFPAICAASDLPVRTLASLLPSLSCVFLPSGCDMLLLEVRSVRFFRKFFGSRFSLPEKVFMTPFLQLGVEFQVGSSFFQDLEDSISFSSGCRCC